MKTILVPTDFSPVSMNAVNYATELALNIDSSIVLVNAYQIPVTFTEVPVIDISIEEIQKVSLLKLNELKKNLEHITSGKLKIYTETKLGYVSEVIEDLCEKMNPILIVMGTKGSSEIETFFMGSNALSTVLKVKYPVMVIPPGVKYKKIVKIGFACDLKEVVKTTPAKQINYFTNVFGASLTVLNVNVHNNYDANTAEQILLLQTMLDKTKPHFEHIQNMDVAEGIHSWSEKNCLDLLITIPKRHRLIERLFQRNHTKDLIFQSHIPIMCIHE
jgi:nucleotide-binding universal stress UspA family protein